MDGLTTSIAVVAIRPRPQHVRGRATDRVRAAVVGWLVADDGEAGLVAVAAQLAPDRGTGAAVLAAGHVGDVRSPRLAGEHHRVLVTVVAALNPPASERALGTPRRLPG